MKKPFKIYMEQSDYDRLKAKASSLSFEGKGAVSHLLEKIAKEPIVFLDSNLKSFAELFLTPKQPSKDK